MSRLKKQITIKNEFINFAGSERRLEDSVEAHGTSFIESLEGTFGCVYERGQTIKAFTDWIGQYPLYFLIIPNPEGGLQEVVFANHMASFLSCRDYAYANLYRVPPSFLVTIDLVSGKIDYQRYYGLPRYTADEVGKKVGRNPAEIGQNYRRILYEEVEKRLPPDGTKIGIALGGIDSLQVLKVLADLRPDDITAYTIFGSETSQNREIADYFKVRLVDVFIEEDKQFESDRDGLNRILDTIEGINPLDVYCGVAFHYLYQAMSDDNIEAIALGNAGNAWAGAHSMRTDWFNIDLARLVEIPVRRRMTLGYPPASGYCHQQFGSGTNEGLAMYDLKLASAFGIGKTLEPFIYRKFLEFALNIPADHFKFSEDEIGSCFSGMLLDSLLKNIDLFPLDRDQKRIIPRLPVVYQAFRDEIPDRLFYLTSQRVQDSVGITNLMDKLGGQTYILNRFNTRYRAQEPQST